MPLPRRWKIRRAVLSRQEMLTLENAAPTERNQLIIRFMADTGTREGAVGGIRCSDLIAKEGRYYYVRVTDKTSQERHVPVEPALRRRLRAWVSSTFCTQPASSPRWASSTACMSLRVADHVDMDAPGDRLLWEVLLLAKMNWNSASFGGRDPITLKFSGLVGEVMREIPPGRYPLPHSSSISDVAMNELDRAPRKTLVLEAVW
jgi:hypothetical protein